MWQLGEALGLWEKPTKVAVDVVKRLERWGAYVYHTSKDRNSVYVHFRNLPNGLQHKLRVSTHDERERYGYKWQLRLDGLTGVEQKRWSRYYVTVDELCTAIDKYYARVEQSGRPQMNVMPPRQTLGGQMYGRHKGVDRQLEEQPGLDPGEVAT